MTNPGSTRRGVGPDGTLTSGPTAVSARHKRDSPARRKSQGKRLLSSPDFKDQLLCDLELRQTVSIEQIRSLEQIRRELVESRNSFAAFYQQSPIAYVTLSQRGYVSDANQAAVDLLGLDRERLQHLPFAFVVERGNLAKFLEHLAKCRELKTERIVTQIQLRVKKQELVRAQLISVPLGVGNKEGFLTAIVDLTERSRNEQKLAEAKEFSESIVETVSQPLVVLDADFRIVSVNRAFVEFFKQPADYVRGRVFDGLLNLWWSGNQLRDELERVLVKDRPLENFLLEIEPREIGKHVMLLNARRLHRESGSPPFILVAMEDITARKNAEVQLREMNADLEERVAARTRDLQRSYEQMESFCYSIAHDLRAPLRSMTGFSELLIEDFSEKMGPEGRNYAERIAKSSQRMDDLIKDLLSYGRLNTVSLPLAEVPLEDVFQDILRQHEKDIQDTGAVLRKKGRLPAVFGHRVMVHAVLANLISNALKFVAPGVQPKISVSAENRGANLRVWVSDNGIGIAPENRGKIFGVFQRLHSTEHYPGTGIGLAIVAKGVERMGGQVGLESEPGKGSRFWFELRRYEGGCC